MTNPKKYWVIAKVGAPDCGRGERGFVKYRVNNLVLFAAFLDATFPDWRYFNVFDYTSNSSGHQIGSFTKNNRPGSRYISEALTRE